MKKHLVLPLLLFVLISVDLRAQDRSVPFNQQGTIFEVVRSSPYAVIWKAEIPEFDRLLAFEADSLILIEIYRQESGAPVRVRKLVDRAWFASMQTRMDSVITMVAHQGGPLAEDDIEDLRTSFTIDQTGYSALHGLTIASLLESPASFWIVTGGSYFAISALSDNMAVTRANVEAASYGHLTGIFQGYAGGIALFAGSETDAVSSVKAVLASASVCGIGKAILSYHMMNGPDVDPTAQYLRLVIERHSLLWGAGAAMIAGGGDGDTRAVMGAAAATSLSSLLWSKPVFGLSNRKMSWGDALLVDEFMTPWYLTLLAATASFDRIDTRSLGAVFTVGGIGGCLLGMAVNEGGMRELSTVKRTRLLMYGGTLLGLGIAGGAKIKEKAAFWVVAGTTWLGYVFGTRSDKPSASSSSWDLKVTPEGVLLGSLDRPSQIPRPVNIAQLSYRF